MNKKFYQLKRDGWYLLELREIKADAFDKLEGWYVEESNVRIIIFGTRKRWDSGELGYLYRQRINWTGVSVKYIGEIRNEI